MLTNSSKFREMLKKVLGSLGCKNRRSYSRERASLSLLVQHAPSTPVMSSALVTLRSRRAESQAEIRTYATGHLGPLLAHMGLPRRGVHGIIRLRRCSFLGRRRDFLQGDLSRPRLEEQSRLLARRIAHVELYSVCGIRGHIGVVLLEPMFVLTCFLTFG